MIAAATLAEDIWDIVQTDLLTTNNLSSAKSFASFDNDTGYASLRVYCLTVACKTYKLGAAAKQV